MILLRLFNLMLLLGLVACLAGAMAGLIVFAPFVGGAWLLTLLALAGSEPNSSAPRPATRFELQPELESRRVANTAARSLPAPAGRAPA